MMNTDEQLLRLTGIVESLVDSVVPHAKQIEALGKQIGALIQIVETQGAQIAAMERQWQAYINTLPHQ